MKASVVMCFTERETLGWHRQSLFVDTCGRTADHAAASTRCKRICRMFDRGELRLNPDGKLTKVGSLPSSGEEYLEIDNGFLLNT